MLRYRTIIVLLASLAMVASFVTPTHAGGVTPSRSSGHAHREPPSNVLAAMPRSVEMVLVVDRIGSLVDSPLGQVVWQIVSDLSEPMEAADQKKPLGKPLNVQESWKRLAQELGMTSREAVDRLVGTRLVIVMRDLKQGDARRWAVISEISEATDRELVTRLRPARRNIVEGHPVRAIENGAYEVTTHLHENAPKGSRPIAGQAGERTVSLLISESGKSELFDELVGGLSGKLTTTLAGTEVAREAARLGEGQILLAMRLDSDTPAPPAPPDASRPAADWSNFLLLSGQIAAGSVEFKALRRDHQFEARLAHVKPWSDAPLAGLQRDAALAIIESRLPFPPPPAHLVADAVHSPTLALNPVERLLSQLGLSEKVQSSLTGRQLLVVPQARTVVAGVPHDPPRLSVCLGAETSDIRALSKLGDQCINEGVAKLEGDPNAAPASNPDLDLSGVACQAVRRTSVDIDSSHPVALLFGAPLNLTWTYLPSVAKPVWTTDAKIQGWWLVNFGGEGSPIAPRRDLLVNLPEPNQEPKDVGNAAPGATGRFVEWCNAVSPPPAPAAAEQGEVRRWFSIGVLRPAKLMEVITPHLPIAELLPSMKQLDVLEWRLHVTPSQDLEGTIKLSVITDPTKAPVARPLSPAPPTPPAPSVPPARRATPEGPKQE